MGFRDDAQKAVALVRETLSNRRVLREVAEAMHAREETPPHHFRIGVYFADGEVNLYQLRQWYRPLEKLNERVPVLLVLRSASAAHAVLKETSLRVVYARTIVELETVVAAQPLHIVLYVNQNARNFQMMRYGRRWHVFINHGESDKMYMTTNQYKAYDFAFIAGQAARERLRRALWNYDLDERTFIIGRPQVDFFADSPHHAQDSRPVLLYAPTWEGDRAAAAYGSVASHGVELVRAALPHYRVIYRPHPRTGVLNHQYAAAHKRILRLIEEANRDGGGHVCDQSPEMGWQLTDSDVAVLDISAMVYDRLAIGKPLLVTRPVHPEADIDEGGFLSVAEWLAAGDGEEMLSQVTAVAHDEQSLAQLEHWREHYFGDSTPGSAQERFERAIDSLLLRWDVEAERHDNVSPAP